MSVPPRTRGSEEIRSEHSYIARRVILPAQAFIHSQALGGGALIVASIVAIVWANSPWRASYDGFWETVVTVDLHWMEISLSLRHLVNDALMVIFFFAVGLEMKRELVHGELTGVRRAALPAAAAMGGMVVPVMIYLYFNAHGAGTSAWGIPMATDIAFALGVVALFGKGIPAELRLLLLAFATADDIGTIMVIAIFYSKGISFMAFSIAAALLCLLVIARLLGVRNFNVYILLGVLVWAAVLKSGVHPTIAGVVLGALTPSVPWFNRQSYEREATIRLDEFRDAIALQETGRADALLGQLEELTSATEAPLQRLERSVAPWVSFFVLPIFALANAGVSLSAGSVRHAIDDPIIIGIFLGLVFGKLIGIFLFCWVAVRLRLAVLPTAVRWSHIAGIAALGGIGFTVSLFLAELSLTAQALEAAKIGILSASLTAALLGMIVLTIAARRQADEGGDMPPLREIEQV